MARIQFRGYAKDKQYKPTNLPTDAILRKERLRTDEAIVNAEKNLDAMVNEGQRLLSTNEKNQAIERDVRNQNKRYEDEKDANALKAIKKRGQTEVAYHEAEAASIVKQGELLQGLAGSVGKVIQDVQASQKQAEISELLNSQLTYEGSLLETHKQWGLEDGVFNEKQYANIRKTLLKRQDASREAIKKIIDDSEAKAREESMIKKIGEELILLDQHEQKDREKRFGKKGYYKARDRLNESLSAIEIVLEQQKPGIRFRNKEAKLALAEVSIVDDYKSVLQQLHSKGIAHYSYNQLTRLATGTVLKHYGLENIHSPAAVRIKQSLIQAGARSRYTQFQKSNNAYVKLALDHSNERIRAAGEVFKKTGDPTALWREVDHLSGEGSSVWNPETNSSFTVKDAIFGTNYSVYDVLYSIDDKLAQEFAATQPRRFDELDTASTVLKKYPDLENHLGVLAINENAQKGKDLEQKEAAKVKKQEIALIESFNLKEGDDGYAGSLMEEFDNVVENGTPHEKQAFRLHLHKIITDLDINVQPLAKKKVWELSDRGWYEFAPVREAAALARKDQDWRTLLTIINNPALDTETAQTLRKKHLPFVNLIKGKDLDNWTKKIALKGLGIHDIEKLHPEQIGAVSKTRHELKADLAAAIETVKGNTSFNLNPEDSVGILNTAKKIVEDAHNEGVTGRNVWSKYHVTRRSGSNRAFYTNQTNKHTGGASRINIAKSISAIKGSKLKAFASGRQILFNVDTVQQQIVDHVTESTGPGGETVLSYNNVELTKEQEFAYLYAFPNGRDRNGNKVSRTDFLAAVAEGTENYIQRETGLELIAEGEDRGGFKYRDVVVRDQNIGLREYVDESDINNVMDKSLLTSAKTVKEVANYATVIEAKNNGVNISNGNARVIREAENSEEGKLPELSDSTNTTLGVYYSANPGAPRLTSDDFVTSTSLIKNRKAVFQLNLTSDAAKKYSRWITENPDASDVVVTTCTTEDLRELTSNTLCYKVK
jgi:hypothetical protein